MPKIEASITGVAGYVPDYILTNAELETIVDTNDEWIIARTGIKERRILKDPELATSYMAVKACIDLLAKTGTDPLEIEAIVCATTTPDFVFPATANLISREIGATNAFGYDLSAACSGFLYSMTQGVAMIESGRYKKVIVVGADKMSAITNYHDRSTCIIFGDGGGAVMLEPATTEGFGVLDIIARADGTGEPYLHQKAGGSRRPPSYETIDARMHCVFQEGAAVFKFAVTNMANVAAEIMERNGLTGDDVAWLVPHQANRRIIEATAKRMEVPMEKVMVNIHKYGNTTNASIPLCLWEYEHLLRRGDVLVMAAFGGGFTWGSVLLRWAYDGDKVAGAKPPKDLGRYDQPV